MYQETIAIITFLEIKQNLDKTILIKIRVSNAFK